MPRWFRLAGREARGKVEYRGQAEPWSGVGLIFLSVLRRSFLQRFYELGEVRQKGREQGVVLILQHHSAEELQADAERGGGVLAQIAPVAQPRDHTAMMSS